MWRRLCMKWIALVLAWSLAERCRWLVSVLTSQRWHRKSESGGTSRMKTNPLQTLGHRNADQGRLAVWSGRPYRMPNLNPVGQERWQACCQQLIRDRCTRRASLSRLSGLGGTMTVLVGNKRLSSACWTNLDATMRSTTLEIKERLEIGL